MNNNHILSHIDFQFDLFMKPPCFYYKWFMEKDKIKILNKPQLKQNRNISLFKVNG